VASEYRSGRASIARAESGQVVAGIEQSVDVIDAEAVDRATLQQRERVGVCALEHRRHFHPDRRQLVDVEEAPIVDFLSGYPPVRKAIGLVVEQRVEGVEAARIPRNAIQAPDDTFDVRTRSR